MSLPAKLKNFILTVDGRGYAGEVGELTLPKLTRKMEEFRGGGMGGAIKYDMGQDAIDFEWTVAGLVPAVIGQYGATRHDALQLRYTGAYQRDDTGEVVAAEVVVRGRHEEIDFGNQKVGDDTETKVKTTCSYYKLTVDGAVVVEIDLINNVLVVGGVDRMTDIRQALGITGSLSLNAGGIALGIGV